MEPIGPEIVREVGRLGPDGRAAELAAAWPGIVGDGIARHAWPARVGTDGTLHVAAESSTWAFELSQLAPQLLERLRDSLGGRAPNGLRFAVGPLPDHLVADTVGQQARAVQPSAAEELEAASLVAAIADAELRETVAATAAASLARARLAQQSDR